MYIFQDYSVSKFIEFIDQENVDQITTEGDINKIRILRNKGFIEVNQLENNFSQKLQKI